MVAQPQEQVTHYADAFDAFEHDGASKDPSWVRELRRGAMAKFADLGFPTARRGNEPWKYTDVRALARTPFEVVSAGATLDADAFKRHELPCPRVHQLVFVDGHYAPNLSTEPTSEAGLHSDVLPHRGEAPVVGRLADALTYGLPLAREHLSRHAAVDGRPFVALNTAFVHDGAFVYIPDGTAVAEPIHLLFVRTSASPRSEQAEPRSATFPRVLIVAGRDSSARLVLGFETAEDPLLSPLARGTEGEAASAEYLTNAVVEVVTQPGASLAMFRLQREAPAACHVATTHVSMERDSRFVHVSADVGSRLARHDLNVVCKEPGASCELAGLYIADGAQHVDNHVFVDHAVPETSSNIAYKGILDGDSRGVYAGQVLVRRDAQHTVAHQINKNLLLSKAAEIDSQPKLEIFADDVKCTHGAAVGQLDQDALFYLKTRGMGEDVARQLLVHGFVNEVLDAINDGAIRQHFDDAVVSRLAQGVTE